MQVADFLTQDFDALEAKRLESAVSRFESQKKCLTEQLNAGADDEELLEEVEELDALLSETSARLEECRGACDAAWAKASSEHRAYLKMGPPMIEVRFRRGVADSRSLLFS